MKKNCLAAMGMGVILAAAMTITSFAGQWIGDSAGWWYKNDDGSYPVNSWQWIDGNKDGVAECYYFDSAGYMWKTGTLTPDGYQVNADGAWVENGVIQTKAAVEKEFDLNAYMRHNNDLFLVFGMNQDAYLQHYKTIGKNENRITKMQGWEDTWIGSCTTYFNETIPRSKNVHLATERINGKVLQPGELMSFSDTILSRTTANGYVSAPAIKRYEIGGGICQVSSTLYAAMCRAGMPAVERHPHSEPISYLPKGLDATISEGYLDLKIQNIYDWPLKIHAKAENGALTVSLELLKAE